MAKENIEEWRTTGELANGRRSQGGQYKRYKDVLKSNLKACEIPTDTWDNQTTGTASSLQGAVHPPLGDTSPCPECQRQCRSQIGLRSHRKSKHRAT